MPCNIVIKFRKTARPATEKSLGYFKKVTRIFFFMLYMFVMNAVNSSMLFKLVNVYACVLLYLLTVLKWEPLYSFIPFIHSLQTFIWRLFKWGYSEALPTPARPNKVVLSC